MVGIIPKPKKKIPEWQKIVPYVSLSVLIAVILGFALLSYFEGKSAASLQDLEYKIGQVGTGEEKAMEKEVLAAGRKIDDFSGLLDEHQKLSGLFELLEETCHPQVWFSKFSFNSEGQELQISGTASNFQTLEQQLVIFQSQELIKSITLSNLAINKKGDIDFSINISLAAEAIQ